MFGVELVPMEFESMPFRRTLFDVGRWPLTVMIESPRPSSVLFATLEYVPGESVRSCWKFRVGSGSCLIVCDSMTRPTCELSCWTSVPSAVTVTVSFEIEGSSFRLTVAVCVTFTSSSATTTVLKPLAETSTLYLPGGRSGTANSPSPPVVACL